MRKAIVILLSAALFLTACSEGMHGNTITVKVEEAGSIASMRAIVPDTDNGNYDISHYRFELYRSDNPADLLSDPPAGEPEAVSGYLGRGEAFTITNVITGEFWKAHAIAYVQTGDEEYIEVADAWSVPTLIAGGNSTIAVSLRELDEEKKTGKAYITLHLPAGIDDENSSIGYSYTVYRDADTSDEPEEGAYKGEGTLPIKSDLTATLEIDGLHQGKHLIVVTVYALDKDGSRIPEYKEKSGVEALRMLPYKDSYGDMYFTHSEAVNPGLDVDDHIGSSIDVAIGDISQGSDGSCSVEVTIDSDVAYDVLIFIDGNRIESIKADTGVYSFKYGEPGTHQLFVTAIGNGAHSIGCDSSEFNIDFGSGTITH